MELFIPSLLVIVLGGIVFFVILPKMAPYTLGSMAVLLFCVGLYQHYQTFPYEYNQSRMHDILKDYSPFIMLLATILGLVIGVMVAFGGNPPDISASIPGMPSLPSMPSMPEIASLPNFGGNNGRTNNATANANKANGNANAVKTNPSLVSGNVTRNNVASNSFKVT